MCMYYVQLKTTSVFGKEICFSLDAKLPWAFLESKISVKLKTLKKVNLFQVFGLRNRTKVNQMKLTRYLRVLCLCFVARGETTPWIIK